MVCVPVWLIISSLKLGDYLSAQMHKPCSISHIVHSLKLLDELLLKADKPNYYSILCETEIPIPCTVDPRYLDFDYLE